mgnify:CR=1 FL=1
MRIYLAAPWTHRQYAHTVAQDFRVQGFVIVSRWHDVWGNQDASAVTPTILQTEALADVADLFSAEALVVLNREKSEGKAVEQGIALALRIPVIIVGLQTNVFHYLPQVTLCPCLDDVYDCLHHFHLH